MRRNRMNDLSVPAGHALGHYVEDLPGAGDSAQSICLSDPATIRHVADRVMERFAEGAPAVSLGMDDGLYDLACASDAELAAGLWDKNFMSPALTDPFMALYNGVAELTRERFPGRRIGFLAYSNITLPPQRRIAAAEPLVAYLAPIDVCPNHGMDDPRCPPRQEYRDVMYRWAETMQGRLIIYDYDQGMLVWRDIPNPSVQSVRQDVRHYRDAGILGVDTESRGAMATTFLNLYLRGLLYWDPDADVEAELAKFHARLLGAGGGPHARLLAGDPAGLGGDPLPRARVLAGPHGLHAGAGEPPGSATWPSAEAHWWATGPRRTSSRAGCASSRPGTASCRPTWRWSTGPPPRGTTPPR